MGFYIGRDGRSHYVNTDKGICNSAWKRHLGGKPNKKDRIVLYEDMDFEITLREVLFSLLILGIFSFLGFLVHSWIDKKVDDATLKYRQAVAIESPEEFRHAMDTDVGHAFVRGKLEAVTPVTNKLVDGEYLRIEVRHQKYQMHTRVVTYTTYDSKGRPHTHHRTETYWSWDTKWTFTTNSPMVRFCGQEFKYNKFNYGCAREEETVVGGGLFRNERDLVYTTKDGFTGTIIADLRDKGFKGTADMVSANIEKYRERLVDCAWPYVLFWVIWIILTVGAIVMFYIIDNEWLED
jgi:hypothetical protein